MALTAAQQQWADAWVAKGNQPTAQMIAAGYQTPAQKTWTPANLQNLANAYTAIPGNQPTAEMVAGGYAPKPAVFDPILDVGYAAGSSAVTNANTHAVAERDYQYHNIGQQTGYDSGGNLITSGGDLNPYAQAALLKRNYDASVRGTTNNYAAQGQLYSGAIQNAQHTNDFNYGASSDQLQRSAQSQYHGQDMNVQNTADAGLSQLAALLGPAFSNFLAQQRG